MTDLFNKRGVKLETGGSIDVDLTLSKGGTLTGRVLDESGRPIPFAAVLRIDPTASMGGMNAEAMAEMQAIQTEQMAAQQDEKTRDAVQVAWGKPVS